MVGEPGLLWRQTAQTLVPKAPLLLGQNSLQETLDPRTHPGPPRPHGVASSRQGDLCLSHCVDPQWASGELLAFESGHPKMQVSACVWGLGTQLPTVSVGEGAGSCWDLG